VLDRIQGALACAAHAAKSSNKGHLLERGIADEISEIYGRSVDLQVDRHVPVFQESCQRKGRGS
jgi:hypothetical protein